MEFLCLLTPSRSVPSFASAQYRTDLSNNKEIITFLCKVKC